MKNCSYRIVEHNKNIFGDKKMNKNRIEYAIDTETGLVVSRVNSEVAIPILGYDDMKPENDYQGKYHLEKMDVINLSHTWDDYKWTRKIPFGVKNNHRQFWGKKPLTRKPNSHEVTALWEGFKFDYAGKIFTVVKVIIDTKNEDLDRVIVIDKNKKYITWSFGGLRVYLKNNPDAVCKI